MPRPIIAPMQGLSSDLAHVGGSNRSVISERLLQKREKATWGLLFWGRFTLPAGRSVLQPVFWAEALVSQARSMPIPTFPFL